jgi:hypothetical protein
MRGKFEAPLEIDGTEVLQSAGRCCCGVNVPGPPKTSGRTSGLASDSTPLIQTLLQASHTTFASSSSLFIVNASLLVPNPADRLTMRGSSVIATASVNHCGMTSSMVVSASPQKTQERGITSNHTVSGARRPGTPLFGMRAF